jgi:transcriptional regulator with XRE-family HTH domain
MVDIGLAFRVALAKQQVSQSELARRIKATRPFICAICNGDRQPSLEMMVKVANALDMKLWEIIKGGEE